MAKFLLAYDAKESVQEDVRKALVAAGWKEWIAGTSVEKRLPRTTLISNSSATTSSAAYDQAKAALTREGLSTTRMIVVAYDGATFHSDESR